MPNLLLTCMIDCVNQIKLSKIMKRRLLLLGLIFGISLSAFAQESEVDVTKLTADTKTFIFSNNKNTVKGYIYSQLEKVTSCCGSDRIYLEVKIDPSGYVLSAKSLTGKNECFKESAIDIIKNVKWDASDFKGPKSVYFEIKPNIDCGGNRENTYAQVEIFNNELLNAQGNEIAQSGRPSSMNTQVTTMNNQPAEEKAKEEPKTDPTPATTTAPPKEIASSQKPNNTTTTPAKPATEPSKEPTRSQDPATTTQKPASTNTASTPPPATTSTTTQPPATVAASGPTGEELLAQKQREEAERAAQEEEIRKLKERMEQLRAKEEQLAERRMEQERQRQEREAQMAQRDQYAQSNEPTPDNSGSGGGLFLDDAPSSGSTDNSDFSNPTDPPAGMSTEDRTRADIAQLEQQKREIEQKRQERDRLLREQQQETQRDNQELFKLEEEILRKQEIAQQEREQRDLDRLEQDRRRAEEQRNKEQDEYQRMMDEIKRLQDEADRKIAELEKQKQDLNNLAAAKQAREQEIMLERTLREAENQKKLEEVRLTLLNNSNMTMTPSNPTPPALVDPTNIPAMTTGSDSAKYMELVTMVNQLQLELSRLHEQIRLMEGTNPNALASVGARGGEVPVNKKVADPGNLSQAKKDKAWEGIEYKQPGVPDEIYAATTAIKPPVQQNTNTQTAPDTQTGTSPQVKPEDEVPAYKSGPGYRPHPSHKDTHANVAGPKFSPRYYVDGRSAMKEKIAQALKDGGACGLGQAVFSVSLDPKGTVINHKVLATNSAIVELQLHKIIPTLQFNSVDVSYDQTIYLEFKADILCEGKEKVNLQSVDPIIKD